MPKARGYCFTSFLPDYELWIKEPSLYIIIGREICPSTGKRHWQGFIYFKNPRGFNKLKADHPGDHIERARGTTKDNVLYCSKDTVEFERGRAPAQGRRSDLETIRAEIDAGASWIELSYKYFGRWCQYGRRWVVYRGLREPRRSWVTELIIIWGPTGTGKTRQAHAGGAVPVTYTESGFILGYGGESVVLFDDWPSEPVMPRSVFLRLFDRYPCLINIKGGERNWAPRRVYITTNYDWKQWYSVNGMQDETIARRVTESINQVTNWVPPPEVSEIMIEEIDELSTI